MWILNAFTAKHIWFMRNSTYRWTFWINLRSTLRTQLLFTSRFPGLMSRCKMPAECRYFRPEILNKIKVSVSSLLLNSSSRLPALCRAVLQCSQQTAHRVVSTQLYLLAQPIAQFWISFRFLCSTFYRFAINLLPERADSLLQWNYPSKTNGKANGLTLIKII